MHTIAIVNEKGGTGKTTTAVNLSAALGEMGQKVLLVDLDGQSASSRWLGVEEDDRLADAMFRGDGLEPMEDVIPGVSLAPASGKLDSVAHELRPTQGGQLRKVLKRIEGRYDLILMDCPPSLGNRLIGNALLAATHVIVPVETSILALDGLKILLTTIEDVREGFGHEIILGGVLACRYDGRTRLSRLVLEELRRALPGKVFHTVIRENVRMRECPASGESILTFASDSHAAEDYRQLAKEMLTCPEAWQKPVARLCEGEDGQATEEPQFRVDDLRSNAAASIRQAAQRTGWQPAAPATGPLPPFRKDQPDPVPVVVSEPPPRSAQTMQPVQTEPQPLAADLHSPPGEPAEAQPPLAAGSLKPAREAHAPSALRPDAPGPNVLTAQIESLSQAEARLMTEEQAENAPSEEKAQPPAQPSAPEPPEPSAPVKLLGSPPASAPKPPEPSTPVKLLGSPAHPGLKPPQPSAPVRLLGSPAAPAPKPLEPPAPLGTADAPAAASAPAPAKAAPPEHAHAVPHEQAPGDGKTPEPTPRTGDDYPALRAYLRRMGRAVSPCEDAAESEADSQDDDEDKSGGLQGLFRRKVAAN